MLAVLFPERSMSNDPLGNQGVGMGVSQGWQGSYPSCSLWFLTLWTRWHGGDVVKTLSKETFLLPGFSRGMEDAGSADGTCSAAVMPNITRLREPPAVFGGSLTAHRGGFIPPYKPGTDLSQQQVHVCERKSKCRGILSHGSPWVQARGQQVRTPRASAHPPPQQEETGETHRGRCCFPTSCETWEEFQKSFVSYPKPKALARTEISTRH